MSTPEQLVHSIKQATDYQTNKKLLREQILTDLHVPCNGGLFKISPDLIAFLNSWDTDNLVLEDVYQNPIKVDRQELLTLCKEHYQLIMNRWHIEHEELRRIRKI